MLNLANKIVTQYWSYQFYKYLLLTTKNKALINPFWRLCHSSPTPRSWKEVVKTHSHMSVLEFNGHAWYWKEVNQTIVPLFDIFTFIFEVIISLQSSSLLFLHSKPTHIPLFALFHLCNIGEWKGGNEFGRDHWISPGVGESQYKLDL